MTIRTTGKVSGTRKTSVSTVFLTKYHYSALFFTSFILFCNTFDADFVYDDSAAIVENDDVTGGNSLLSLAGHDFWGNSLERSGSHKSWRPLTTLTFRWTHQLAGLDRRAFHIGNVLLHSIVSCLVLKFTESLGFSQKVCLTSSLLFAVHPIHCEAVAGLVGRADVLAALFTISGLLYYSKYERVPGVVFFTCCALLSKETGIMLIPLVIAQSLLIHRRVPWPKMCQLSVAFIALVVFRLWMNDFTSPRFSSSDNPIAHDSRFFVRTATLLFLPVFHLRLMAFPDTLCFDWSMNAVPLIEAVTDPRLILSLAFYALFLMGVWKLLQKSNIWRVLRKSGKEVHSEPENFLSDRLLFSLSLLVLPFLPAANLFSYVGFVAAERVLYLPSLGYCIIVAVLLEKILERNHLSSSLFFSFLLLLLSVHAKRTFHRNLDWRTGESLYRSAVHINPPKAWSNLGRELGLSGSVEEAANAYRNALKYRPNMADTWYNLGILHKEDKNVSQAIGCYRTAIQIRRHFTQAYLNLGLSLWENGHKEEAESLLTNCTAIDGDRLKSYRFHKIAQTNCYFNLGRLYASQGRLEAARRDYEKALSMAGPSHPSPSSLLHALGDVHARLEDREQAETFFKKALAVSPKHLPSHLSMAQMRIAQNRTTDALDWIVSAQRISPDSPAVQYTYALLHRAQGNVGDAELRFAAALRHDADYVPALHSLAILLRDQGRSREAEKYLHRVALLNPSASSYSNYGAILQVNGKLEEAEKWYLAAMQMQPNDVIANENLTKVRRAIAKRRK